MAWDVHIHVCFACDDNEPVAELARKHLALLPQGEDAELAAQWFLESLASRTGQNFGPKGGLSLWGMIGNYTDAECFCEMLRPFWCELLSEVRGGPCNHERIIVFEEPEQREAATAYEIGWDDPHSTSRELFIRTHEKLPFSWQQF
jgi:hypothetical protein